VQTLHGIIDYRVVDLLVRSYAYRYPRGVDLWLALACHDSVSGFRHQSDLLSRSGFPISLPILPSAISSGFGKLLKQFVGEI